MRAIAFALLAAALPAHADLYRWVDPESGSPKFSNSPPPWYDTGSGPAVERIPSAQPNPRAAAPEKPAAQPSVPALEARWRALLQSFSALRQSEFTTPDEALRQRIVSFQGLTNELDMVDPTGKARRTAELLSVMQSLKP
jgi:hypothetical protein